MRDYDDIDNTRTVTFNIAHPEPDYGTPDTPFKIHFQEGKGYAIINGTVIDGQLLSELGMLLFAIGARVDGCVCTGSVLDRLDILNIPVPTQEIEEMFHTLVATDKELREKYAETLGNSILPRKTE